MKKCVSLFLALVMMLLCTLPVMAEEISEFKIQEIDSFEIKDFSITYVGQEQTPEGRVDVYSFTIPNDGKYYKIPDFQGEFQKDASITVDGTWSPSYAELKVMFTNQKTMGAVESYLFCNVSHTFRFWDSAEWELSVMAPEESISGTIRVTVA